MSTRDEILDLVTVGNVSMIDLEQLGYTRSTALSHLSSLVADGLIYKHAKGKATYYSTDPTPTGVKDPSRSRLAKIVLPDLPPLMLWWGGYTDKVPDPDAGDVHYPLK